MTVITRSIIAAAALALAAACAEGPREPAQDNPAGFQDTALSPRYTAVKSTSSFDVTLTRLLEGLDRRDLTVFAVIDHKAGAEEQGLTMPPATLVLFGAPKIGTSLMIAEPVLAAELPMRAAVFETEAGEVFIATTSIRTLNQTYGSLAPQSRKLDKIAANLEALRAEVSGDDG